MRIDPIFQGNIPVGAKIAVDGGDAAALASVLSYARNADLDKRAQRVLSRLAAMCRALDADADAHVEEDVEFARTMRAFDRSATHAR